MTTFTRIGAALLAMGICAWSTAALAQGTATTTTTTAVTTSDGAFTEFVPASETVVIRSETNPTPLRYVVTKETTIVDETGAVVAIDKISTGSPMSVQYTGTGDRLVASRIVVRKPVIATEQKTATTTITTRSTTDADDDDVKDRREDRKDRQEDAIEKEEERLDDLKDKVEDDE